MTSPFPPLYKYIFVSISHLGGPLKEEGVEAAEVVFFSYIDWLIPDTAMLVGRGFLCRPGCLSLTWTPEFEALLIALGERMVPSRLIPFGLQELGLRESKQKQKITQLVTNAKIQMHDNI